jgi:signal transduction histidine kinase
MLRRLLLVLVPLLVALFVALAVPLAANIAQGETQTVYLDRLADADRFAALTDDALRRNRNQGLAGEIATYDRVYGVAVAVYGPDGRPLSGLVSRPGFDGGVPGVRDGLATALAGYRSDRIATVWPWQRTSMVVAEPVGRDSGVIAVVVLVSPTDRLRSAVLLRWGELAGFGVLPFLLAVLAGWRLARWVLRPVRDLDRATVAIAAGRLDARAVTVAGPPELRRLAGSFNAMIDTVVRTLRRQRSFASDASHQLRNPLASLQLAVDNLAGYVRPEGQELHGVAVAEVEEMGHVVDNMLALTAVEGTTLAGTAQLVAGVLAGHEGRWRQWAAEHDMALSVELPDDRVATYVPPDPLGNLLDELVGNACRLSGGTAVVVRAAAAGADVVLSVSDDGAGLSAQERAAAGNRYWRGTQAQAPGTGLGLAICREVVDAWGGTLTLHEVAPHGLEVRITLPGAGPDQDLTERK